MPSTRPSTLSSRPFWVSGPKQTRTVTDRTFCYLTTQPILIHYTEKLVYPNVQASHCILLPYLLSTVSPYNRLGH